MPSGIRFPCISGRSLPFRWLFLLALTLAFGYSLTLLHIPASVLLGSMGAGIFVAVAGGAMRVPRAASCLSQAVVGCMISQSITMDALRDIMANWPLFVLLVLTVTAVSSLLGWFLARTGTLPGSTAIWGTSPGAALVMTMMSEGYDADSRMVAFMQYLRVLLVTLAATLVARVWGGETAAARVVDAAAAAFDYAAFAETLVIAVVGALLGLVTRIPSAPILFPIAAGASLSISGVMEIELPWWLLMASYCLVGWTIGLRFTREVVSHALCALPRILAAITAMILICGVFAAIIGVVIGIDPMTAYLATSPGGMDSVAIIAASTGGNLSFIMAVQTTRFLLVTLAGPAIATFSVRRMERVGARKDKEKATRMDSGCE